MKQLKYLIPFALIIITAGWWFSTEKSTTIDMPQPTNGQTIVKEGAEDGDNQAKREAWFELMHSTAPGTSWKTIEYQTSMQRHVERSDARNIVSTRGDNEILANGNLTGQWFERGSINQSGSVFVTEYDAETDMIYLISAGGTLFKGPRSGNQWEVLNQDLRFENNFLKLIDTGNGKRLLANIIDRPHYSDDEGSTWTPATGITFDDSNARTLYPIVLKNVDNHVYLMTQKSYWEDFKIFKSVDNGESYFEIVDLETSDRNQFRMIQPNNADEVYLIEKASATFTKMYTINQSADTLQFLNSNTLFIFGNDGRANLTATKTDSVTRFYAYNHNNDIYSTEDFGATWTLKGEMPSSPWSVGVYVSASNPDLLMMGEVDCFVSPDGGVTWARVNNWWEYYDNVNEKMHADMMYFNEFKTADNTPFILVSNHGGLNLVDTVFGSIENLGLTGLNVSQYYDVATDPTDPSYMYAGAQDQGFQRALSFDNTEVANFDQVISGDYGHIVFAQGGFRMWTVYPGGWVTCYNSPQTSGISASWEINSSNETVWIPPLMASPDETENAVYLAGGNMEGGEGSYLIKLTYNQSTNSIDTAQIDYDFRDFSTGGTVSMMRTSPVNSDHWYVSTTNGRFFYSYDGGNSWDQTIQFIPEGHYLYGSAIYPSKIDSNTVYFAGSGYSNPAVYKSTDGGQNFVAMNTGMPATLVFELAANEDETMFFAATEAGPYVYVVADEQWYDMSGMGAPNQTYWSVEYNEESDIVRFGTYGRGIWDFQILVEVSTSQPIVANESLKVFPNPTSETLNMSLETTHTNQLDLEVRNIEGKLVAKQRFEVSKGQAFNETISLTTYPKGTYVISLKDGEYLSTKQVILQ